MKKIIIISITLLIFYSWYSANNYSSPTPDYGMAYDSDVTLYATSWCGYCEKARKLLRENHIKYFEYDIEKSAEGREQYNNLRGNGVPILLIKGRVVDGYNPEKILALAK